ncbi:hypothetical protein PHISCL_03376 [Aspergillus sclerotialis]|uniref:FAM192A/Fyv6 N-terminal domain-containing protein n=1 Tax=Aspergillus sclerotialis TaxID=2070753 RepID=A0A3A2ZS96_9EURO|nr:hypothetical protein PHISCL_03376 [Aspergillus sclerotialis]
MSSGFVSAGTNEQPIERDEEWHRVQQELEEERRRKAEIGKQEGGKSLYEVLQSNKMAKQEAFEEKIKLKNQFRSLDEDEVEFLDSVLESTRAQEAAVKKETAEQLEVFRQQREEAEKALLEGTSANVAPNAEGEDWKIPSRKRRRDKNKDLLIPGKKRKSVTGGESSFQTGQKPDPGVKSAEKDGTAPPNQTPKASVQLQDHTKSNTSDTSKTSDNANASNTGQPEVKEATKPTTLSLGLADYGSDSD